MLCYILIYLLKQHEYPHFLLNVLEQDICNRCKSAVKEEKLRSMSDQREKARFFWCFCLYADIAIAFKKNQWIIKEWNDQEEIELMS